MRRSVRNTHRRNRRRKSRRLSQASRARHQQPSSTPIPSFGSHHIHHLPTPLPDDDQEDVVIYQRDDDTSSDDDSSISSSDSPRRAWDVEEWSDDEIHQNLEDLQDFEFLNSVHRLRIDKWEHSRLNWDAHVRQLVHEDSFENEYGMPLSCYNGLVHILRPKLQKKDYNCRGELITTEHVVANGLRILGGGRPKDQRHIVGMSRDASYKSFCSFLDAVNSAPELDIKMPSTPDEWDEIYQEYRSKSTHEIMAGCVGCLDGFFQRTNKPTKLEVANVISYYSGHYESYGINCQACVRANLQFMYFGVVSPGSTNDNISFPLAPGLKEIFDSLPPGLFGLADAAYTLSEKLLIPFVGTDRCDPSQDAFSYYLSQLCIRVEMAFGRLINKFRILNGKVGGSMD